MLKSCETARFVLESRSSSPPPFDHNLLQQLPRRAPPHSDEGSADIFYFWIIIWDFLLDLKKYFWNYFRLNFLFGGLNNIFVFGFCKKGFRLKFLKGLLWVADFASLGTH